MALKIESTAASFEQDPHIQDYVKSNTEIIEAILENAQTKLGEGNTANVHFLENNPDLCLKILKSPEEIAQVSVFNRLEKEMGFLSDLQHINRAEGVRVPKPYLTADYEGVKFLLMERLHAHSIIDIINGQGTLPNNFNIEAFHTKLKQFIEAMHEQNIYHRDLHSGNIMVDPESGETYIIDFGASTRAFSEDNPYAVTTRNGSLMLTSDEDYLSSVYQVLKRHLLTQSK